MGRIGLVVNMSVTGYICPLPMQFFRGSKGGLKGAKPSPIKLKLHSIVKYIVHTTVHCTLTLNLLAEMVLFPDKSLLSPSSIVAELLCTIYCTLCCRLYCTLYCKSPFLLYNVLHNRLYTIL